MSKMSGRTSQSVMLPGAHRQVHTRASGAVAIYWYAFRGGPQIATFKGVDLDAAEAAEFAGAAEIATGYGEARSSAPAPGQFAHIIAAYKAHPAFTDLRPDTRRTYRVWLDSMLTKFGAMSPGEITSKALGEWREAILKDHGARAADHALRVFTRVCSWGREPGRELLPKGYRPHEGFKRLYKAPPQDEWKASDIEKIAGAREDVQHALLLALNTGLRRGDLVRLRWDEIDEEANVIRHVTQKKERRVVIRRTKALRDTLALIPRRHDVILTHSRGPWSVHTLGHAVNEECARLGIQGRLHGLRRSAATHLAKQGLSSRQIARQLGWSEADAEAMAAIYVEDGE